MSSIIQKIVKLIGIALISPMLIKAAEKPINIGQTLESRLGESSVNLDNIAYETWQFSGKVGQQVIIEMTSEDFDSLLKLTAPDGNVLVIDDNGGVGYNARISIKLPMNGKYTIEATTVWQMRSGNYRLTVTNIEVPVKTGVEKLREDFAYYEKCLKETKNPAWASELHTGRLIILSTLEADKEAVEAAELALILAEKSADKYSLVRTYLAISNRLLRDGDADGAIKYFEQVIEIQRELKNRIGEATTLSAIADAYLSIDNFVESKNYYQQALVIYQELQDKKAIGFALFGLGQSHRLAKQFKEAIPYYEKSLTAAKESNNLSGVGYSSFGLADCQRNLENYDEAFLSYQVALRASREDKERNLEGTVLAAVADTYRLLGKYDLALPFYKQNIAIRNELKDLRGEAYTLNALAICEKNLSLFSEASKHYDQMLAICRQIKDRRGEALALLGLGASYRPQDKYQDSVSSYEQALVVVRELKDRRSEYTALIGLGDSYTSLNQPARALPYLEQALAMNLENNSPARQAVLFESLANVSFVAGQYEQAAKHCEKVLSLKRESKDQAGEVNTLLLQAAIAIKRNELTAAIEAYNQAKNIFSELKNQVGVYTCLYGLAKIANQQNDAKAAQTNYEAAINIIENFPDIKSEPFFGLVKPLQVYQTYIEMLVAKQLFPAALTVSERIRAYQFRDLLTKNLSSEQSKQNIETFKPFVAVDFVEILQTAQRLNATILDYLPIENGLLIFLVKPDSSIVAHHHKIDINQLNTLLDKYRSLTEVNNPRIDKFKAALAESVNNINIDNPTTLSDELRALLMPENISNALPMEVESKLLVVASGKLSTFPFMDLKDVQGTNLIDRFVILQTPSISTLSTAARQRNKPDLVVRVENVALGIPAGNSINNVALPVLSEAKDELKAATNFKATALTGVVAVKDTLCEQGKNKHFLHLIAYSYLNDKEPLKSFVLLTPQTNEQGAIVHDGVVSLVELNNCIKNNDLVILSNNQSGFSSSTGDGIFFLANSLAVNNCSASLLSLWQVDNKISTLFIESFYEQLRKTPDIAISYRRALLKLREKYKSPSQWAAFVLMGEPVN